MSSASVISLQLAQCRNVDLYYMKMSLLVNITGGNGGPGETGVPGFPGTPGGRGPGGGPGAPGQTGATGMPSQTPNKLPTLNTGTHFT